MTAALRCAYRMLRSSAICAGVLASTIALGAATIPQPTTTSLSANPTTGALGTIFTFAATVTVNGQPVTAGSVLFTDGKRVLGSAQLIIGGPSAGTAILKTASFGGGSHNVTAIYTGALQSLQSTASSSSSTTIAVTGVAPTSTSLTILPGTAQPGTYDLTATLLAASSVVGYGTLNLNEVTTGTSLGTESVATTGGFLPPQTSFQDTEFSAAAVGDFNGDGVPDLALIDLTDFTNGNFHTNLLIEFGDTTHPGQFLSPVSYLLSAYASWIAVGDLNGDGLPDLVVGSHDTDIGVLLNDSSNAGQFTQEHVIAHLQNSAYVARLADLNGDGILDLAVPVGSDVVVFFGDAANPGQFLAPQNLNLSGLAAAIDDLEIADFNQDGLPDLAVTTPPYYDSSPASTAVSIFLADPAHPGQFTAAGTYPAPGSGNQLIGDFNGDGLPDILAGAVLLLNDASHPGTFQSVATSSLNSESFPNSFLADVNGDGIPDLIGLTPPHFTSCTTCDTVPAAATVLLSDPAHPGQFTSPGTQYSLGLNNFGGPLPSALGDFNGDGQPDFVAVSGNGVAVMIGTQIATLTLPNAVVPGTGISSVAAAYTGDAHYKPSSSSAVVIESSALLTTTRLTTSATEIIVGSQAVLTASVQASEGTPAGSVAFYDGASVLCTGALNTSGTATCSTNLTSIGAQSLYASYAPSGPYASSTSNSVIVIVTGAIGANSLTASPNPILVSPGIVTGVTTIQWSASTATSVEVHVGSPSGTLFVAGGSTGSATTGQWVADGMLFYLQDVSTGQPLTAANTLALLVVHVQQQPLLSASPNPIPVQPGSLTGATTITWNVPLGSEWFLASSISVEVHIGSPTGPLFASGSNTGSAITGNWVTNGMVFYLQDVTGGKPLTATNTIALLSVRLEPQLAIFTADPDPIQAQTIGATTLHWNAPTTTAVEIHLDSPRGPLFAEGGSIGSAATGDWVTNGMVFYLQDVSDGKPLSPINTLARLQVKVGLSAYFSASPNPVPNGAFNTNVFAQSDVGSTTLQWNAPTASAVEIHVGSPSGTLLTTGGKMGSVETGWIVTDGLAFYLQDASKGDPTSPGNTLSMLVMHLQKPSAAFLTANPNPIQSLGLGVGTTTLEWNAPSATTVQIRVGTPDGTLLAEGGSSGTAATGNTVTEGMLFYLQDVTGGKPLTSANTLAVFIATLSN